MYFINAGVYHQGGSGCSAWNLLELGHSSQGFKVKSLWIQSGIKATFSALCLSHIFWIKKCLILKYFWKILVLWFCLPNGNFSRTLSSVSLRCLESCFSENLMFMAVHSSITKVWWRSAKGFFFPRNFTWLHHSWKQCSIICLRSIVKWANCQCEFPHLFVFISTKLSKCCW